MINVKIYPYIIGWRRKHLGCEIAIDYPFGRLLFVSCSLAVKDLISPMRPWLTHFITWLGGNKKVGGSRVLFPVRRHPCRQKKASRPLLIEY